MKHAILLVFLMGILFSRLIAQCENYSLKQEVLMTQNIALVQGMQVIDDSVEVHIIKKWKGNSYGDGFKFKIEPIGSQYFRIDSGRNYLLFWFDSLQIDPCSRSAEYKHAHYEKELDEILSKNVVLSPQIYDSLNYIKRNVFKSYRENVQYDIQQGKFAFYDVRIDKLVPFKDLPKELSYFNPRRFYVIDKNIETAHTTYDAVFAVLLGKKELILTKELKKKALQACFK